jgi:hypothetical protein
LTNIWSIRARDGYTDIDVFAARFNDARRRQAGGIRVADGGNRRILLAEVGDA